MGRTIAVFACLLVGCGAGEAEPAAAQPAAEASTDVEPVATSPGAVLVELFTSQGCSSCPAADSLLPTIEGVIALSFHVDYWNYIGWKDPFSSSEWSKRQRRYAGTLDGGRVYTPQLVVNGRAHVVGSNTRDVRREIAAARTRGGLASVVVRMTVNERELGVTVDVALTADAVRDLDVMVAVYQSSLATSVSRGENAGRKLRNDFVVRRFQRIGRISAGKREVSGELRFDIPADWNLEDVGVVAFVQDPKTMHVLGAGRG